MKTFTIIALLVASTSAIRVLDDDLVLPPLADNNDIEADKQILAQQQTTEQLAIEDQKMIDEYKVQLDQALRNA